MAFHLSQQTPAICATFKHKKTLSTDCTASSLMSEDLEELSDLKSRTNPTTVCMRVDPHDSSWGALSDTAETSVSETSLHFYERPEQWIRTSAVQGEEREAQVALWRNKDECDRPQSKRLTRRKAVTYPKG